LHKHDEEIAKAIAGIAERGARRIKALRDENAAGGPLN
jgi:hypothetical protein